MGWWPGAPRPERSERETHGGTWDALVTDRHRAVGQRVHRAESTTIRKLHRSVNNQGLAITAARRAAPFATSWFILRQAGPLVVSVVFIRSHEIGPIRPRRNRALSVHRLETRWVRGLRNGGASQNLPHRANGQRQRDAFPYGHVTARACGLVLADRREPGRAAAS